MTGTERVRALLGPTALQTLEHDLSPSDLSALLMSIAQTRAAQVTPARLLTAYQGRFTKPSASDPRKVGKTEGRLWDLLPAEFEGIELSPVAPLGTSAIAGVSQNRIVSAGRSTEVVSDATNVLALEAALRRKTQRTVDLAASHRLLRAQDFGGPSQHFRLFSLVSSARDTGSGRTEIAMLEKHLSFWRTVVPELTLGYTLFRDSAAAEKFEKMAKGLGGKEVERTGADYYTDIAFKLYVGEVELGDGGLTDWTAKLLQDNKERCLISCLSTERLTYASR